MTTFYVITNISNFRSKLSLPRSDFFEQPKISFKTKQRIFESCGFILLKEKVADPCETVADEKDEKKIANWEREEDCPEELQDG